MDSGGRRFDRRYFDKWYRSTRHRVATPADFRRRAMLAIAVAESMLGRPVRSVLDVGCGEARWRTPLLALRPGLRYHGVDSSSYVVEKFGRARGIRFGTVGGLGDAGLGSKYDIVVCADVLHYVDERELERGLIQMKARLGGVAYLPTFTSRDAIDGDTSAVRARPPIWYRRRFAAAGLTAVGLGFYVSRSMASTLAALELPARR